MELQNIRNEIHKLDEIYRNSPTVRAFASQAPLILSIFKEMRQDMIVRQMEIDRICYERSKDIEKFRIVADKLTDELSIIGQEIRNLQKNVREKAAMLGADQSVEIQINYTNLQISDLINMFNSLTTKLLMA